MSSPFSQYAIYVSSGDGKLYQVDLDLSLIEVNRVDREKTHKEVLILSKAFYDNLKQNWQKRREAEINHEVKSHQ